MVACVVLRFVRKNRQNRLEFAIAGVTVIIIGLLIVIAAEFAALWGIQIAQARAQILLAQTSTNTTHSTSKSGSKSNFSTAVPNSHQSASFAQCDPYTLLFAKNSTGSIAKTGVFLPNSSLINTTLCAGATYVFGFPDNLDLISKHAETLPEYFQNKMILLIGDSFERRLVEYICRLTNGVSTKAMLNGAVFSKYFSGGGDPNICVIRKKDKILVFINIFNFGVRIARNPAMGIISHWTPGLSPFDAKERATWIPHFLLSISNHTFPELCIENHICPPSSNITRLDQVKPWNASAPFWFPPPDLVVAQSGLWDLKQRNTDDKDPAKFVHEWTELLKSKLLQPLKNSLGNAVRDDIAEQRQKWRRWFTRTIPYISAKNEFQDSFVEKMNAKLHYLFDHPDEDYGLLDWAALIGNHHDWLLEDGFHPSEQSNRAYWQFLLSRLQILHENHAK